MTVPIIIRPTSFLPRRASIAPPAGLRREYGLLAGLLVALLSLATTLGDEVTINRGGSETTLTGRVLAETQNENGILFQTPDGKVWRLAPEEMVSRSTLEQEFKPLTRKQLGQQIQAELNSEFKIHEADEFVIVHNTSRDYARWVAGLYRRFEKGFGGFWAQKKFRPEQPEFPLAVVIFAARAQYEQYMLRELGIVNRDMIAYYNLETNRVAMFDLTAEEFAVAGPGDVRRINTVLNNPRAIPMVATIIHEGTHLLMFNNGMQTRFSDTPLWINEGIAMYFEVPDLDSNRGWGKIGRVNNLRLGHVLHWYQDRPENSLQTMIQADAPFRGDNAINMYAQAWAFNYFLLNRHEDAFVDYLKFMSEKPVLSFDTPEQRLVDFQRFFKTDLNELDREFVQYIRALNR